MASGEAVSVPMQSNDAAMASVKDVAVPTQTNDAEMAPAEPVPVPMQLTDDLLGEILTTVDSMTSSLVCRLWNDVCKTSITAASVREGASLSEEALLRELSPLLSLRSITLRKQSVKQLTDTFFHQILRTFPRLERLEVVEGAVLHGTAISAAGLLSFLSPHDPPASPSSTSDALDSGPWERRDLPLRSLKLLGCEHIPLHELPTTTPLALSGLRDLELSLAGSDGSDPAHLAPLSGFLASLLNLTSLVLRSHSLLHLPPALGALPKLKSLCLKTPQLLDLPEELGQLKSLTSFHLFSRAIQALPDSLSKLTDLRRLHLDCKLLEALPGPISRLTQLRSLSVAAWRSNTLLPASVFTLPRLTSLEAARSLAQQAEHLSLLAPSLQRLTCHSLGYDQLRGLPPGDVPRLVEGMAQLSHLKHLSLSSISLDRFPAEFGAHFGALEELSLEKLDLVELPAESFGSMRSLRVLSLSVLANLAALPDTMRQLSKLQELKIGYCRSLRRLPDCVARLPSLKLLSIWFCLGLTSLPAVPGGFQSLEQLEVSEWAGASLWVADLADGGTAPPFLDPQATFKLRRMTVKSNGLRKLPKDLGRLAALEALTLQCEKLVELPSSVVQLGALKLLALSGESLRRLPEDIHLMSSLERLSTPGKGCPNLEVLPESLTRCLSLRALSLFSCSSLQELPAGLGLLPKLQELRLGTEQRRIDGSVAMGSAGQGGAWDPQALQTSSTRALHRLPDSLSQARDLQVLEIINLRELRALPEALGGAGSLRRLVVSHCPELQALPPTLGQLSGLRELDLAFLPQLRALPDGLEGLRALRSLHVKCCAKLQALPESLRDVGSLLDVRLEDLEALEKVPEVGRLTSLVELSMSRCPKLVGRMSFVDSDLPLLSATSRASLEALNASSQGAVDQEAQGTGDAGNGGGKCVVQ